jgi:putative oxidoreductase
MNEKTKSLILIIGAITLAIVFIAFGAGKFIDPSKWETKFEAWGLPIWFVAISGAIEIAGGLALFLPVLRGLAGIGLTLFMIGAVMTHVAHAEIMMIFVAGAILAASAILGWVRFPETVSFVRQKLNGASTNSA